MHTDTTAERAATVSAIGSALFHVPKKNVVIEAKARVRFRWRWDGSDVVVLIEAKTRVHLVPAFSFKQFIDSIYCLFRCGLFVCFYITIKGTSTVMTRLNIGETGQDQLI